VRIAWKEEEEERAKKAAEAKEAVKDGVGKDGAKGKKRKRGHAKGKAEDLDESTLQRKVLIRRYKKHSVPKETTELMWGGLDVDRVLYLLRIALNDLMTRSNSHIEPNFFLHLSQTFPKLSWMLLPDYLAYVKSARSAFLKQHVFLLFSELLKRPEATGEHGEGLVGLLSPVHEAFTAAMKDHKQLKSDYLVSVLQCLKQVIDVLQERAGLEPSKIRAELLLEQGRGEKPHQLQEMLSALVQARRVSQAICAHASKIYLALSTPLPADLQKSQLPKHERKKQRREERKKRQEERERKRLEKLAHKNKQPVVKEEAVLSPQEKAREVPGEGEN